MQTETRCPLCLDAYLTGVGHPCPRGGLSIQERIHDRYAIESYIASGGHGAVYRAQDERMQRPVALKVLFNSADGRAREKFLHEARLAARVEDTHVVAVHDFFLLPDGRPCIVMQLVEGPSLRREIGRRHDPAWVCAMGEQIARGLHAIHQRDIVHRDLKPENILLVEPRTSGQESTPLPEIRITDFGIAKDLAGAPTSNVIKGTPQYLSPEQIAGPGDIDGRADQYALGVTLYELLAGAPPFDGDARRVMSLHLIGQLPRLTASRPDVPGSLEAVVLRMLARDREARFPTIKEVERALRAERARLAQGSSRREAPVRSSRPSRLAAWVRRLPLQWRLLLFSLVGALLAAAGVVAALLLGSRSP